MADSWKRWLGAEILLAGTEREPPIGVVGVRARAYPFLIRGASKNRSLPGADEDALACFVKASRSNRRCHVSRCYCAVALIRLRRFVEAAEQLDVAVRAQPEAVDYRYNRAVARACCGDIEGALEDANAALRAHDARWKASGARAVGVNVVVRRGAGAVLAKRSLARAMAASTASLPASLTEADALASSDGAMGELEGQLSMMGASESFLPMPGWPALPSRAAAGAGMGGAKLGSIESSLSALRMSRAVHESTKHTAGAEAAEARDGAVASGLPPVDWDALSCMPSVVASLRKSLAPQKLPPVIKARFVDDIDARLRALGRGELHQARQQAEARAASAKGGLRMASAGAGPAAGSIPSLRDVGSLDGLTMTIHPHMSLATLQDAHEVLDGPDLPQDWAGAGGLAKGALPPVAGPGGGVGLPKPAGAGEADCAVGAAGLAWGRGGAVFRRLIASAVYMDKTPSQVHEEARMEPDEVGSSLRLRRVADLPPDTDCLRLRGVLRRRLGDFAQAFEDYAAAMRIEEAMAQANGLDTDDDGPPPAELEDGDAGGGANAAAGEGGGGAAYGGTDGAQAAGNPAESDADLRRTGDGPAAGGAPQPAAAGSTSPGKAPDASYGGSTVLQEADDLEAEGTRRRRHRRASVSEIPEAVRREAAMLPGGSLGGGVAAMVWDADSEAGGAEGWGGGGAVPAAGGASGAMRVTLAPPIANLHDVVQGVSDLYSTLFGRMTDMEEALGAAPGKRSPEQCARLSSALAAAAVIRGLSAQAQREVAQRVVVRRFRAGQAMCTEGEDAEFLGVIVTGTALVKVAADYKEALVGSAQSRSAAGVGELAAGEVLPGGAAAPTKGDGGAGVSPELTATLEMLGPGDTINELGLLWGSRHVVSVVAECDVTMVALPAEDHFALGLDSETLRQLEHRRALLRRTGALGDFSSDELMQLATVSKTAVYNEGTVILEQGSLPPHLCVLARGIAGVFRFSDELAALNRQIRRLSEELSRANFRHRFHHNMLSDDDMRELMPLLEDAEPDSEDDDDEAADGRCGDVGETGVAKADGSDGAASVASSGAASGATRQSAPGGSASRGARGEAGTISPEELRRFIRRRARQLDRAFRAYPLRGTAPWRFTAVYARRRELQQELLALLRRKMTVLTSREASAAAQADAVAERRDRRRRIRERNMSGADQPQSDALAEAKEPADKRRASVSEGNVAGSATPSGDLGARVQTLFPPSIFAEQAVTDPLSGLAPASVLAETMCEVLLLPKHRIDMSLFPAERRAAVESKAPVYPSDAKLRAKRRQDASWDAYKAGLMERVSKRKWPVNKLMVRHVAGGRSIIRSDPPPGMMGAVMRSSAAGLPRTDVE